MQTYISVLIHNKRLEKEWTLESLSHGICSSSYLSKLEKGALSPKEDIVEKLLQKLNVHLEEDLNDILSKVDIFYHSFILFHIDETYFLTNDEISKLLNSQYCLDGLLIRAWQTNEHIEELKDYVSFFSYEQKKRYYQILVYVQKMDFHELLHIFPEIDSYSIISDTLHRQGKYAQSIPYYIQYYEAAARQCDLNNMAVAKMGMGSVYACLFDIESCLEEYQQALKLIQSTNLQMLENYIYYNIAATYTELKHYDQALMYLSKIHPPLNDMFYYHKLAICYEKTGHKDKAMEMIQKGYQIPCRFHFLLKAIQYRLMHPDYIHEAAYEDVLLQILQQARQILPTSFAYLQKVDLLEYYEENRKYKEAYEILKNDLQK